MSTAYYTPGATMYLETYAYPTTQVGTIGVRVRKLTDRTDVTARTTAGIAFDSTTSSHWIDTLVAPAALGEYDAIFDIGETPPWPAQRIIVVGTLPFVPSTPSGSDLTSLANAKNWLGITDSTQDARLQQLITAASGAVMQYAQREFAPVSTATRHFALKRDGLVTFGRYDLQSASAVVIDAETGGSPTTLSSDSYQLRPVDAPHGVYNRLAFYTFTLGPILRQWAGSLYRDVSVTGTWGFAAIPSDVEQAALVTVAKWFKRDEVAWSNELPTPSMSDGLNLPFDARMLVQPYKRVV